MNIQALKYFAAVAEGYSVSSAAQQFGISQPALSRSIQRLEEELGCDLFRREDGSLRITPKGAEILLVSRRIIALEEHILTMAQNEGNCGSFLLGCCGGETGVYYKTVRNIRRKFPDVSIDTPVATSCAEMLNNLVAMEIDGCFACEGYSYARHPDLRRIPIQSAHYKVVVPIGHRAAKVGRMTLSELVEEQVMVWRKDVQPDFQKQLLEHCTKYRVAPTAVDWFSSKDELFAKVAAENGVAVVHSVDLPRVETEIFAFVDLVTPKGGMSGQRNLSFFWNANNRNPILSRVIEVVQQISWMGNEHY